MLAKTLFLGPTKSPGSCSMGRSSLRYPLQDPANAEPGKKTLTSVIVLSIITSSPQLISIVDQEGLSGDPITQHQPMFVYINSRARVLGVVGRVRAKWLARVQLCPSAPRPLQRATEFGSFSLDGTKTPRQASGLFGYVTGHEPESRDCQWSPGSATANGQTVASH